MSRFWKFVKDRDTIYEKVLGRNHHWHYNAEISKQADIFMVKVVMPPGGMHNFHRHPEMSEILYILKGRAEQWVEEEKQVLEPNESVYIEANLVHATFNVSDEELEFLAILSPSSGWEAGTIDEYENLPYSEYRPI
jgi:quercetin dioxygenase-like cupin family protein